MKEFERLFGADRGTEIHSFIEAALGPCPCRDGQPCWELLPPVGGELVAATG